MLMPTTPHAPRPQVTRSSPRPSARSPLSPFRWSPPTLILLCIVIGALLTGCVRTHIVARHDARLDQSLRSMMDRGGSVLLSDLTDFPWDAVYLSGGYTSGKEINRALGERVLSDRYRYGYEADLLFFSHRGEVVRALAVGTYFAQEDTKWGSGVRVVTTREGKDPAAPYRLALRNS